MVSANDETANFDYELNATAHELEFEMAKHAILIKRQARSESNRCSKVKASDKKQTKHE